MATSVQGTKPDEGMGIAWAMKYEASTTRGWRVKRGWTRRIDSPVARQMPEANECPGPYKTQYGIDAQNELLPEDSGEREDCSAPSAGRIALERKVNLREGRRAPGGHLR